MTVSGSSDRAQGAEGSADVGSGSTTLVKWATASWSDRISRLECIRETAACVWVADRGMMAGPKGERRMLKDGVHDTWEQAHAALMARAESKLISARRALQHAQDSLGNVKGMKKPPEAA